MSTGSPQCSLLLIGCRSGHVKSLVTKGAGSPSVVPFCRSSLSKTTGVANDAVVGLTGCQVTGLYGLTSSGCVLRLQASPGNEAAEASIVARLDSEATCACRLGNRLLGAGLASGCVALLSPGDESSSSSSSSSVPTLSEQRIKIGSNVSVIVSSYSGESFVSGGRDTELGVWSVESPEKPTFRAKGLPHDKLNLRRPVDVRDARWLPGDKLICCATGQGELRLYSPGQQRRPTINFVWEKEYQTLFSAPIDSDCRLLAAGNSSGKVGTFDLRRPGQLLGLMRPSCHGSARRGVVVDAVDEAGQRKPTLLVGSEDRFLRAYDCASRSQLCQLYCKSSIRSLAACYGDGDGFTVEGLTTVEEVKKSASKRAALDKEFLAEAPTAEGKKTRTFKFSATF